MFSEYLDKTFAPLGRKAGLSGDDVSLIWTPQIIASLIDVPVGLWMTDLGMRLVNAILGIGTGLIVGLGKVKGRTAAELSEMASYWITQLYVPAPHSPVVAQEWIDFVTGIASGNWAKVQNAIFKPFSSGIDELKTITGIFNPTSYNSGTNTPLVSASAVPQSSSLSVSIKPAIEPQTKVTVNRNLSAYVPSIEPEKKQTSALSAYN